MVPSAVEPRCALSWEPPSAVFSPCYPHCRSGELFAPDGGVPRSYYAAANCARPVPGRAPAHKSRVARFNDQGGDQRTIQVSPASLDDLRCSSPPSHLLADWPRALICVHHNSASVRCARSPSWRPQAIDSHLATPPVKEGARPQPPSTQPLPWCGEHSSRLRCQRLLHAPGLRSGLTRMTDTLINPSSSPSPSPSP